jgi:hypothetical protein
MTTTMAFQVSVPEAVALVIMLDSLDTQLQHFPDLLMAPIFPS